MMRLSTHNHQMPGLNTASLPDLIFTVLFFFMIVTHMRKVQLKVHYRVPQGTELTRLTKKSAVSYIYIGRPVASATGKVESAHPATVVQLNDKLVTPDELAGYMAAERERMSPADKQQQTVSIKADIHTPLAVVNEVKLALRQAKMLRINYSAVSKSTPSR